MLWHDCDLYKEDITFAALGSFLFTCLQGEEIFCYEWQAKEGVYAWEKIELNWEVIHQTHEDYLDLNPLELADLALSDHMRFQLTAQVLRARQGLKAIWGEFFWPQRGRF